MLISQLFLVPLDADVAQMWFTFTQQRSSALWLIVIARVFLCPLLAFKMSTCLTVLMQLYFGIHILDQLFSFCASVRNDNNTATEQRQVGVDQEVVSAD